MMNGGITNFFIETNFSILVNAFGGEGRVFGVKLLMLINKILISPTFLKKFGKNILDD